MSQPRSEPRCSQDRWAPSLGCLNWLMGIVVWGVIIAAGLALWWVGS